MTIVLVCINGVFVIAAFAWGVNIGWRARGGQTPVASPLQGRVTVAEPKKTKQTIKPQEKI